MTRASPSPLKFGVRADLFSQLATMEDAGLPFNQAFGLTQLPPAARQRLAETKTWLSLGQGVADAGLKSGLFTDLEASLLRAAFSAGSPSGTYRRLADYYARKAAHSAAMKSRMMLPLAMIVIAIFLTPLPKLVTGTLSPGGYLLRCLLPVLALGGLAYLFVALPYRLSPTAWVLRTVSLDRVLLLAPWFGPMYARRNVRDFLDTLALLLEAGMPILEDLPMAVAASQSQTIRRGFSQLKPRVQAGASFAQAVGELSFAGDAKAHAMIVAGEASGKLPEVLFRYVTAETQAINRFDDLVAQWVPRLAYIFVALAIGYGIISSGAFMPALPEELR